VTLAFRRFIREVDCMMRLVRLLAVVVLLFQVFVTKGAAQWIVGAGEFRRPVGFRVEADLSGNAARLDRGAKSIFSGVGSPSFGLGYGLRMGYDWERVGVGLGLELGAVALNVAEREGMALLSLVVLGRWQLAPSWGLLRFPELSVGFVRQGIGSVAVPVSDLPPDVIPPAGPGSRVNTSLLGNGLRLGFGAGRGLGERVMLTGNASVDLTRYDTLSVSGDGDMSRPDAGLSVLPKVAVGVAWWPF
jgi:hypothetical protein